MTQISYRPERGYEDATICSRRSSSRPTLLTTVVVRTPATLVVVAVAACYRVHHRCSAVSHNVKQGGQDAESEQLRTLPWF